MIYQIIIFIIGVSILLVSTEYFLRYAVKISKVLKISPLIIGLTVVAIGTSIPELAVSVISAVKGDTSLAIGNIVGSNILNITVILPIGILLGNLRIGTTKTQKNVIYLLLFTLLFSTILLFTKSAIFYGLLFIALAILFTYKEYIDGKKAGEAEDAKLFKHIKNDKISIIDVLLILILITAIILGSYLVVNSTEKISILLNISTSILGLSLTAMSTSLPELLTTILSQRSNEEKMTIGNIIGSNIYNLLLIGGVIFLFPLHFTNYVNEILWLIACTGCLVVIIKVYAGRAPHKVVAIGLLLISLIYLYTLNL